MSNQATTGDGAEAPKKGARLRREIAPRTTGMYDSRETRKTRAPSQAGLYANIFNPKQGRVITFQGFGDQGEKTTFRPFPPLDPYNPTGALASGRGSTEPGHYSHWQQVYMIAKWVGLNEDGCEKVTLVLGKPGDPAWMKRPYQILSRRIFQGKKGRLVDGLADKFDIRWLSLLEGDSKRGAQLSATSETFFIQCAVYKGAVYDMDKKKNIFVDFLEQRTKPMGLDAADPLPIMILSKSTGYKLISGHEPTEKRDAIESLLDRRKADHDPESQNYDEVFFYGDPVGNFDPSTSTVSGGVFVSLFMPSKGMEVPKFSTWDGEIDEFQGYEAQVLRKYRKPDNEIITADLDSDDVDRIFDKAQFWDESAPGANDGLITMPSEEEEALLVAKAFKKLPHMLRYAWADKPEWFTPEVNAVLGQKVMAVNPKARLGDDAELTAGDDDELTGDDPPEPTPPPAPKKDRTVAAAAAQRQAAAPAAAAKPAARKAPPREPDPEPEPDPVDDVVVGGGPEDDLEIDPVDPDLTADADQELGDAVDPDAVDPDAVDPDAVDEPEPVEQEEEEGDPEPLPAPTTARRPAASTKQKADDDFFDEDLPPVKGATKPAAAKPAAAAPAAAPKAAAKPAAAPAAKPAPAAAPKPAAKPAAAPAAAAKPAAKPPVKKAATAEDDDENAAVMSDPAISAKTAESEAQKKMRASQEAINRAAGRSSAAQTAPKPAPPAAKGGTAGKTPPKK